MFDRAVAAFKRVNAPGEPENSIIYRVFVFLAVAAGVLSIYSEQGYDLQSTGLGLVGIALGNWLSWERKGKKNYLLKFILSNLLLLAFFIYLQELFRSSYDPRVPLAKLFLWILVLHSFDLPARKDLRFSLVSSFIMIAMAGAFSISLKLLPFLIIFVILGAFSLFLDHLSELKVDVDRIVVKHKKRFAALVSVSICAITVLAAVAFFFLPRPEGLKIRTFPTAVSNEEEIPDFSGQIVNPALPFLEGTGRKNLSGYFGFSSYLDLNFRGGLSEEVIFVVRTTSPNFYRGLVFNEYDGRGWKLNREKPEEITAASPPFLIEWETPSPQFTQELIQTYYIIKEQPNIIYAPYQADLLYFPSFSVWRDKYSALRSPFLLPEGMVYTVASRVPVENPDYLKRIKLEVNQTAMMESLQVPAETPERVMQLAKEITAGKESAYEKARAIQEYLETKMKYDLEIPPFPENKDVVDYFLFKEKKGYCEHFASAFVILCRAAGLPARLVTGFAHGDYNFLTGYYDVKVKHAHAWAEVFFPVAGWLSFNPTPGFDEPVSFGSNPGALEAFMLSIKTGSNPVSAWLKKTGILKAVDISKKIAVFLPQLVIAAGAALLLLLAILLSGLISRRLKKQKRYSGLPYYFDLLLARMARAGLRQGDGQTPREAASLLGTKIEIPEMEEFLKLLERELYSGKSLTPEEVAIARRHFEIISSKIVNG